MSNTTTWPALLRTLLSGDDLAMHEASWAMDEMVSGRASNAQIAGFLVALAAKGETVTEVLGFRETALQHARPLEVNTPALDIVGTGGDQHNTVNISTTASIVAAACGVPVVKHGNRASSSASGSSDVLDALGVDLTLTPDQVAEVLTECGITFAFAAAFHPGFKNVAEARRELGVPTVFNILGPLCNPAQPVASAVGVARAERIPLIVGSFQSRDAAALVFRGDDGLDELSTTGHNQVWEVCRGRAVLHDLDPTLLGIPRSSLDELRGGDPAHNAQRIRETLTGEPGPVRDIVLLNAAAGLVAYDLAVLPDSFDETLLSRFERALDRACAAIDSGRAEATLNAWVSVTSRLSAGETN
jgi:anthranilate phosphoribosyltransferase